MNILKKTLIWFLMLAKRLLIKKSFVLLIILIPMLIPLANSAMKQESGVVRIALCNIQNDGISAKEITEKLKSEESIISYSEYEHEAEAREAVRVGKADAAWVFHGDFDERLRKYMSKESIRPVITIINRENSVRLSLAREKLFGKLYSVMVYEQYEKFVREEILTGNDISDSELEKFYRENILPSDLIEIRMQGAEETVEIGSDYLTAPLRGLMSLLVMLCSFVAAGISMKEKAKGTYTWLSAEKRIIPAFGSCLAAAVISGGVVLVSLFAGGVAFDLRYELIIMAAYVLAVASLCTFISTAFDKFEAFGALIPFLMLGMLVLCPVFFSIKALPALRLLMPPYYYLMSVHNAEYAGYMPVYSLIMVLLSVAAGKIKMHVNSQSNFHSVKLVEFSMRKG